MKTKVAHKSVSMKSPRTSRSARFAAVTALAALVLAACGGSDAPQAAAPVAEAPAIPAPPPAPPVVSQLATLRSEFASSFGFDGDRLYWVESVPGQGPMIASMPRTGGTLVDHRSLDRPFPEPNGVTNWNVWHADTFFY
ncbi:MAG TPA: hypothetical protein VLJ58_14580, partial [Ramlibacter sp.]|nr:hypothetical protein [Ramlibacter sp.]